MYLIPKRKQTHTIQPQKEGNSDTHHDMNEPFFPFCTVKSFADNFLICLQVLTWVNLEDIVLMKSAGHKRTHTPRVHSHEAPEVIKVLETGSGMAVSGARGMKDGELVFNGHSFHLQTLAMNSGNGNTAI